MLPAIWSSSEMNLRRSSITPISGFHTSHDIDILAFSSNYKRKIKKNKEYLKHVAKMIAAIWNGDFFKNLIQFWRCRTNPKLLFLAF